MKFTHVPISNAVIREVDLSSVRNLLRGGNVTCITGAGCSTESGIPDYRSPQGSYSRGYKPMTQNAFMTSEFQRKRYWIRSIHSWESFSGKKPNNCHITLDKLCDNGSLNKIITQNVDGFHRHKNTIPLHGELAKIICAKCGVKGSRYDFQKELKAANPNLVGNINPDLPLNRSDGDVDLDLSTEKIDSFNIPPCHSCGSLFTKPDVVLFGGVVPEAVVNSVYETLDTSSGILVLGSSLQVYSAWRFVKYMIKKEKPLHIINIGPTRGDKFAATKIEHHVTAVLPKIASSIINLQIRPQ